MSKLLGTKLAALRRKSGLSQKELAARLGLLKLSISNQAISKWENGLTEPSAEQFLALCRVLEVDDISAYFNGGGILRGLNDAGAGKVREYADILRASGLFEREEPEKARRSLPLYALAVSAGTGEYLDGSSFDRVEVDDSVPDSAKYGVRVAGDSMEPRYHSGETVWIRPQETLLPNEIDVFVYNGSAYLKQLHLSADGIALRSLNPAYVDIKISSFAELKVLGKAVT
ncbi:MAG: XRE family transcriptional regulator [Oscillospiraceae bacterium]|nr:XRE family transcriptional regulator [Oscillospiraceae bacterium]